MHMSDTEVDAGVARLRELGRQIQYQLSHGEYLEEFAESFALPLFATDARGNILWCNVTWCEVFGYQKSEAVGMNVLALLDADSRADGERFFRTCTTCSTGKISMVLSFIHKDGGVYRYLTIANAHMEGGRFHSSRCVLMGKDVLNGSLEDLRAGFDERS